MGWDIYGTGTENEHACNGKSVTLGYPAAAFEGYDPIPRNTARITANPSGSILNVEEFTAGPFFSGGPYLGVQHQPASGRRRIQSRPLGFCYMWHSHNENEIVNFNIFPGGDVDHVHRGITAKRYAFHPLD